MPYDFKKFIFSVSLCAMLAVNPVLATAPTNDEDLGTTHDVYVESTLNQATNGIAGVSYVNRMVNAAGNAADAAEAHAAAAGAHALSAAQSAEEAHKVLADKVSIDQGADDKNKVMVTDDEGSVYAGYVAPSMIADGSKIDPSSSPYSGFVLWSDHNGNVSWKSVDDEVLATSAVTADKIANGAVTTNKIATSAVTADKIANGAVTENKIADGAVTASKIADGGKIDDLYASPYSGFVLWSDHNGNVSWKSADNEVLANGAVETDDIANGAVTWDKIANGAVTWDKIANGAVMANNISGGAVTSGKIANGAVTADKLFKAGIPDDSSTTGFLAYSGTIGDDKGGMIWRQVQTDDIADGAVTAIKIADGAVMADQISGGAVTASKIAEGAVVSGKIGDGAVIEGKIANGAVTTNKIANGAVTIDKTAGVVGMVPVGGEGATTYGSFWIE